MRAPVTMSRSLRRGRHPPTPNAESRGHAKLDKPAQLPRPFGAVQFLLRCRSTAVYGNEIETQRKRNTVEHHSKHEVVREGNKSATSSGLTRPRLRNQAITTVGTFGVAQNPPPWSCDCSARAFNPLPSCAAPSQNPVIWQLRRSRQS